MISLVMVEEALNELTAEHIECCAVELPDSKRGSKIVAVSDYKIDPHETNKLLAKEMSNLALPKQYVVVGNFPRMGSGKTDFRGLTEIVKRMDHD